MRKTNFRWMFFVAVLCFSITMKAQEMNITGILTTEKGAEPLPGVTIIIVGTNNGTSADFDGNYSISAEKGAILEFSFIGMKTIRVTVAEETEINVSMEDDAAALDEVVVVGYGTQRKADVTGAAVRINTASTEALPNINILQSLKGQVAGLNIGTPDRPGEEPGFSIRGTNSISVSNTPLIVLDGIIYNGSLNNISNTDIASVDVLKDASAAAVYGSRSANGVIIITTKTGASEKPKFQFNTSYGTSDPTSLVKVLSPERYLQKLVDYNVAINSNFDPNTDPYTLLNITEQQNFDAGRTINWLDQIINTASMQTYDASVSGRTDKTNYYIAGSYTSQDGILANDNYERFSARINLSNQITDHFKFSIKSSVTHQDYSGVAAAYQNYALSPYGNWFEGGADSGELEYYPMEDPFFRHPELNFRIDDHDKRLALWGLVSTEIKIPYVKGLKLTTNFSMTKNINNRNQFQDNTLAITQNGTAYKQVAESHSWTFDNILNYNRTFNDLHNVGATFLVSREYGQDYSLRGDASNFFNQGLGYHDLGLGGTQLTNSGFSEGAQSALMGRVNYGYDNRYAITGTVRRDGFSGFSAGNKFASFYSGAFSWTASNESFLKDVEWIDRLKVRLSYGENGNQAVPRYGTLARISSAGEYVFNDGGSTSTGVAVSNISNSALAWETTGTSNFGLDFGFFNDKLFGSLDIYKSTSKDLILNRNLPTLTGFSSIRVNIGELENKGVEIALNSNIVQTDDFSWEIGGIFTQNRNEIVSLVGSDNDGDGIEDDNIGSRWFIGKPLGAIFGYAIDGIHQTGDSDIPSGYKPGEFRIVDYDGDGELTADDRHILGYSRPNYSFSIRNTFTYQNFSLHTMINSIQGGGKDNYYVGNNIAGHNPNNSFASWTERFSFADMDYWTPSNPSNTASRIDYQATRGHGFYEDRSFIRLQDVTLAYSFNQDLLGKLGLQGLKLYVTGKNLVTITDWTGYDPENATTIAHTPMLRTITFGANLNF